MMTLTSAMPQAGSEMQAHANETWATIHLLLSQAELELRKPLSLIQGYIETLKTGAIQKGESMGRCLEVMDRHSRQLMHVIDDLNAVASLEAPTTPWSCDDYLLRKRLETAVECLMPLVERSGVQLEFQIPPGCCSMLGDREVWHLIFSKLIEEAVKHLQPGSTLRIGIRWEPEACVLSMEGHEPVGGCLDEQECSEACCKWENASLGLLVVKRAVEMNHGTFEWCAKPSSRPSYIVRMPCSPDCRIAGGLAPAARVQETCKS